MSWIDAFISYTSTTSSPELFRKWTAISTVAAALERKTWTFTAGSRLYPNLYVILCAPPGVGKSEVTWRARTLLEEDDDLHIASSSLTKASLIDELADSERKIVRPQDTPPVYSFNSLTMFVDELGVLLPSYENDFMNVLTNIYDGKVYSEKRRTSKIEIEIKNPQLNILAATTPSYLNNVLPEGAWDQGFLSRTIIIYTGDKQLKDLFDITSSQEEEFNALVGGLKKITSLFGEFKFTEEVKNLINTWHKAGGPPAPEHPKLIYYNSRRTAHLLKLCQVAAADTHREMIIYENDFHRALDWLIEAEHYMPEIFKAMSSSGTGKTMEEAWYYLFTTYAKEQKPILEYRLIQFLQERVPVHQIAVTIDMMEKGGLVKSELTAGGKGYIPKGKQPNT